MTCPCGNPSENLTTGLCASCGSAERKAERMASTVKSPKRIPKMSNHMRLTLKEYSRLKKEFIKDKICPVFPHLKVVDIHHMKGKEGSLFLDTRYWLAVSLNGHILIELNPRWAKENGYSLSRGEIISEPLG